MLFLHSDYASNTVAMFAKNTFTDKTGDSIGHRINITFRYLGENRLKSQKTRQG